MTHRDRLLAVFVAQGSAIAGERLTLEAMIERLETNADFRAAFNGPTRPAVVYPDAETAALAEKLDGAAVCAGCGAEKSECRCTGAAP